MSKKIVDWIKYLFNKQKHDSEQIEQLKKDLHEIKKKQEILAKTILQLYENKK